MNFLSATQYLPATLLALLLAFTPAAADDQVRLSAGQTVYVPVYANVFSGPKALPFHLAAMLSIRNTDPFHPLKVTTIEYYDNDGRLVKKYLDKPLNLGPLASSHTYIKEGDDGGGFGANFIVRWDAAKEINAPIIESVMIGAKSGQGISFISQGQVISEKTR